jgi:aryl-alcohol dehydrogenase-like predicted oxidoreductase
MDYRNLGRTGVKVSQLCLGTMMFGRSANEKDSIAIIHHALDHGINFVDTANAYSGGTSERYVGKALGGGRRARTVLATKVFFPLDQHDLNGRGLSRRHIVQACEASLERLGTEWIDLYQLHRAQSDVPIDETLRALDDLIRAGKVRYIGTSMFAGWKIVEALWAAKELGLNRFVCEQMAYNLLDRTAEREVVPAAQTFGVGLIPWTIKAPRAVGTAARTTSTDRQRRRRSMLSKDSWHSRTTRAARRRSSRSLGTRASPGLRHRSSDRARSTSSSTTSAPPKSSSRQRTGRGSTHSRRR